MVGYKSLLTAVLGLLFVQNIQAQEHNNLWLRTTLSIPIGKKFKIDNEFQHRRQNGFENVNFIDKNLMFTYRSWVHFQNNEDIKFSLSPFAYFTHYKIIQKKSDESTQPNSEIRFSAAVELQHQVVKKIYLVDRTAIEYRMFQNNQSDITRLRNRFGFRYDITSKFKIIVFDELLLNVFGTTTDHFLDHNRLGLNIEYKVIRNFKFDFGYMHITRLPISSTTQLHENNIFLNLTFQLHKRTKTT